MSTPEDHTEKPGIMPEAGRRRTIWPNLVWGIPIVAMLIVGYLGVRALLNRGERVTVTFTRAAGAKAGVTKVLYQGIEAGQLTKIEPNADGRRLDFHLRLVPAAKSGLNTNARFWLIGANPNFSDLSSLKAVVSGIAIGYAPGEGGEPEDHFEGLDQAPLILPGDKGTRYSLAAHSLNSIHEGSIVLFHGQAIGKVIAIQFNDHKGFHLQAFINQPYDSLIRRGARFWKISPLRLSFAGGGITANLAPLSTFLAGGTSTWKLTPPIATMRKAPPASEFPLLLIFITPRDKDCRDPRCVTNLRLTAMREHWMKPRRSRCWDIKSAKSRPRDWLTTSAPVRPLGSPPWCSTRSRCMSTPAAAHRTRRRTGAPPPMPP